MKPGCHDYVGRRNLGQQLLHRKCRLIDNTLLIILPQAMSLAGI